MEGKQKLLVGDLGAMEKMLEVIKTKLQSGKSYGLLVIIRERWISELKFVAYIKNGVLWSSTSESANH